MPNNIFLHNRLKTDDAFKAFGLAVLVYLAANLFGTLFLLIGAGMGGEMDLSLLKQLGVVGFCQIVLAMFALFYCRAKKVSFLKQIKAQKGLSLFQLLLIPLISATLIMFMLPIQTWFAYGLEKLGFVLPDGFNISSSAEILVAFIVVCLFPSFCEEAVFRGIIGNAVANTSNKSLKAALISGALFSLMHMNPYQTLHTFVLGVAACLLLQKSHSFWACFLLHFCNNFLATFVLGERIGNLIVSYAPLFIFFGILLTALFMLMFWKVTDKRKNKTVLPSPLETDSDKLTEEWEKEVVSLEEHAVNTETNFAAQSVDVFSDPQHANGFTSNNAAAQTLQHDFNLECSDKKETNGFSQPDKTEKKSRVSFFGLCLLSLGIVICSAMWIITLLGGAAS